MDRFAKLPAAAARASLRPAPHPSWVAPMLATLTERRFSDPAWLYERKLDGERRLAFRNGAEVRLLSRTRRPLEGTYPEILDAISIQPVDDIVVDGEVVAFAQGRTSFERLQQRLGITDPEQARHSPVAVFFYVFDLLHLDGHDTSGVALRDRKALLRQALSFGGRLRYTAHRNTNGEAFLAAACAMGWEGVVAKRAAAPYVARRSPDWLKFKCSAGQEFVIGGFTEPASGSARCWSAITRRASSCTPARWAPGTHRPPCWTCVSGSAPSKCRVPRTPAVGSRARSALGQARTGCASRVHRVDRRRQAAAPTLRGPAT
jgi:ATP-dependent DNA ligase